MSLLEDVFLQDEANEAEQLERVIDGDEFEERRRSDSDENSEKEDEAEEDKRRVDPKKTKATRVVKNPRFILNPARLTGPRGIQVIPEHFKDFKFKGKGHEKEDLDLVLKKLEHWAYRLYPKFQFEDCLKKIEMLGKKRPVAVHLHKIRSDQFLSEDTVVQKDSSDEDTPVPVQEEDEFDKLLQQQIELARSTPAPNSAKKPNRDGSISPKDKRITSLMMPKATSSPSINDEQRERMLRSRKLAEERRLARLKNAGNTGNAESGNVLQSINNDISPKAHQMESSEVNMEHSDEVSKETDEIGRGKKLNRSNVIDSSDEESVVKNCVPVAVDVHTVNNNTNDNYDKENEKSIHKANNDNNQFNVEGLGAKEIETMTQDNDDSVGVLNSELSEGVKSIAGTNENVVETYDCGFSNTSVINNENASDSLNACNNLSENSDENQPLKYDDSDMNIDDTHNHNTSNGKGEKTGNSNSSYYEETPAGVIEDTAEDLDKHANNSKEENDVAIENANSVPEVTIDNGNAKEHDRSSMVPEELFQDIMDVDFTEDF